MRGLGIVALIMTVLSLVLWFINWIFFTFLLRSVEFNSPLRYVAQASSFLSALTEYLAIGLLSIGLIMLAKRVVKS